MGKNLRKNGRNYCILRWKLKEKTDESISLRNCWKKMEVVGWNEYN